MTTKTALALLCAFLLGALARDVLGAQPAHASTDVPTRGDLNAIIGALKDNAKANADVARAVRDAGRACK